MERGIIGQEPPLGVVGRNEDGGVDLRTEVSRNNMGEDGVTVSAEIADGGVDVHRELTDNIPTAQPQRNTRRRGRTVPGNATAIPAQRGPTSRVSRINRATIPGGRNASDGGYHIRDFGFGNNNLFTAIDNLVSSLSAPVRSFSDIRKDLTNERATLRQATSPEETELCQRCISILMRELENYERAQCERYPTSNGDV